MSFPQVTRYIGIYSKDSGFKVVPCNRYSGEKNGAKVISVTDWCVTVCLTVGREHLRNLNTGVPQTFISDFVVVLYWQQLCSRDINKFIIKICNNTWHKFYLSHKSIDVSCRE